MGPGESSGQWPPGSSPSRINVFDPAYGAQTTELWLMIYLGTAYVFHMDGMLHTRTVLTFRQEEFFRPGVRNANSDVRNKWVFSTLDVCFSGYTRVPATRDRSGRSPALPGS